MIVRSIAAAERERFTELADGTETLSRHVAEAFDSGAASEEWCLVAEEGERWLGRAFLRAAPKGNEQIFLHFFHVELEHPEVGRSGELYGFYLAVARRARSRRATRSSSSSVTRAASASLRSRASTPRPRRHRRHAPRSRPRRTSRELARLLPQEGLWRAA
jgi:hypothetical protein